MEHSTPSELKPREATIDFIKRFARDYRPKQVGNVIVTILHKTTSASFGQC